MRKLKLALLASATMIGCLGAVQTANAQVEVYGGGASFPSLLLRDLFNCAGLPVGGAPVPADCVFPALNARYFYGSAGSGAGKRAFRNHDGTNGANGLGTGVSAAPPTAPYSFTLPATGFPNYHFSGSDDIMLPSDLTGTNGYFTNGIDAFAGAPIQIPMVIGPVTITFNPPATVSFTGATFDGPYPTTPPGARTITNFNLSRQAVCGIFSGNITKWNNPILTALGVVDTNPAGSQITVVHRSDGSGTTFIFTQALKAMCAGITGPTNETIATKTLYELRFTDRTLGAAGCPSTALPIQGSNQLNWPTLGTDQCATAISNPGGGVFIQGSGNGGVRDAVKATPGAIGYVSADFAKPYSLHVNANEVANLQNQYAIDNGLATFTPPTPSTAETAMASAQPIFDLVSIKSPLSWGRQGVVGNPVLPDSYPISGFSWFEFYQCYNPGNNTLSAILNTGAGNGYLFFHYGAFAAAMMNNRGYGAVPQQWINFIGPLVADPSVGTPMGAGSGACAAKSGA